MALKYKQKQMKGDPLYEQGGDTPNISEKKKRKYFTENSSILSEGLTSVYIFFSLLNYRILDKTKYKSIYRLVQSKCCPHDSIENVVLRIVRAVWGSKGVLVVIKMICNQTIKW